MKRTRVEMVCDVHHDDGATTRRLGLDGVVLEIDLCDRGSRQLDEALAPYTAAARRLRADGTIVGTRSPRSMTPPRSTTTGNGNGRVVGAVRPQRTELPVAYDAKAARAWWRAHPKFNGERLPEWRANGALPRVVQDAYRESLAHV